MRSAETVRRAIKPEILDELAAEDRRAIRSRRDLQRINILMGNARLLACLLGALRKTPRTVVEIGSGDGTLMLALARRLGWREPVKLQLLDMQPVISSVTLASFRAIGWEPEVLAVNLHDWIKIPRQCDLIVANLFLHHFKDDELRVLFQAFAKVTNAFASCEPRRWRPGLIATHLLWAIGCNDVTRHDAVVSVRAGFRDQDLTALWPSQSDFVLREEPGNYASHLFFAESKRRSPGGGSHS